MQQQHRSPELARREGVDALAADLDGARDDTVLRLVVHTSIAVSRHHAPVAGAEAIDTLAPAEASC